MATIDYFKNGRLIKVIPNTAHQYDATVFNADNKIYDLLNPYDVKQLPVPSFITPDSVFPNATENEDYILRMVASNVRDTNHDQSILF